MQSRHLHADCHAAVRRQPAKFHREQHDRHQPDPKPGGRVEQQHDDLQDTIRGFKGLVEGKYDHLPEAAFYMVGTIDEAVEKGKKLAAEA